MSPGARSMWFEHGVDGKVERCGDVELTSHAHDRAVYGVEFKSAPMDEVKIHRPTKAAGKATGRFKESLGCILSQEDYLWHAREDETRLREAEVSP
jgi:hypothetical protein